MAEEIAKKSPVAVQGTKHNIIYSRDHSVDEGLDYIVSISSQFAKMELLLGEATLRTTAALDSNLIVLFVLAYLFSLFMSST